MIFGSQVTLDPRMRNDSRNEDFARYRRYVERDCRLELLRHIEARLVLSQPYRMQLERYEQPDIATGLQTVRFEADVVPVHGMPNVRRVAVSDRAKIMHDQIYELLEEQAPLESVLEVIQMHLDGHADESRGIPATMFRSDAPSPVLRGGGGRGA